jgi:hypothetical protein
MLSKRVIMVVLGLIISYFATYFGDNMHVIAAADFSNTIAQELKGAGTFIALGTAALSVFGALTWCLLMRQFIEKPEEMSGHTLDSVSWTALTLILFAYAFGVLAAPFTNYGAYPWYWASAWDFLPLLALVPMIMVVHDIFTDITAVRRNKKESCDNVTPIRRSEPLDK